MSTQTVRCAVDLHVFGAREHRARQSAGGLDREQPAVPCTISVGTSISGSSSRKSVIQVGTVAAHA
ncbi:hypothetical protein [Kutzneria buriramensis]|uniref:hypothetical protein n=1 Tax=Kutzneria buriramensis TaxID=1045776 RepID=UPI001FE4F9F7|nr:hypothetical protein [Kutzneria buriramensis]